MDRYTDHSGPQDAPVKYVARLKDLEDCAIVVVFRFGAIDGLMQMGIEGLADWVDALHAELRQVVQELFVNKFEAFAIIFIFGFAMGGERVFESVDHGNEPFDEARGGAFGVFEAFLFDALAIVVEAASGAIPPGPLSLWPIRRWLWRCPRTQIPRMDRVRSYPRSC
jgi:hypothetical protein